MGDEKPFFGRKCALCGRESTIFTHIRTKEGEILCCDGCYIDKMGEIQGEITYSRPISEQIQ